MASTTDREEVVPANKINHSNMSQDINTDHSCHFGCCTDEISNIEPFLPVLCTSYMGKLFQFRKLQSRVTTLDSVFVTADNSK